MAALTFVACAGAAELPRLQKHTTGGIVEGALSPDGKVLSFKGIPYAAPPVGNLRWNPPQPIAPWTGVRPALEFGPRPMQRRVFEDMVFRDRGPSEDCLYLNLWVPQEPQNHGKLPVMVWIFGGGFVAGATSEPRQDGTALCQKGVIVVSMNYRLGVFGFLAHPELTKESAHHASGNYGLLDQIAALHWVHDNIAAFGGDPQNVTIFGESAGSYAVSALVASPQARGLFQKAIGESGALFSARRPLPTLAAAEEKGRQFAHRVQASSLAALRALSAQQLLDATAGHDSPDFGADIDGYVLPSDSVTIYGRGEQAHVPLLAGWNRDEGSADGFLEGKAPTPENFAARVKQIYGDAAGDVLRAYRAGTDAETVRAAADLAGDRFIAYSTWKWIELHQQTSGSPVYRYKFDQPIPPPAQPKPDYQPRVPHASDIEFVFQTLQERHIPWTPVWSPDDRRVSDLMAIYWTNFAKTGNPNGSGVPEWPRYEPATGFKVMHLRADATAAPDVHRDRYLLLDRLPKK